MKRNYILTLILALALLSGVQAWADAPAGYAIYGDVPAGFTNLTSAIEVHNTSETFSGSPQGLSYSAPGSTITFTGSGNPGRICENKADLLIRFKADQPLTLTEDMTVHVMIRRTTSGTNAAQMSFCRTKWNTSRMSWIISADHLSELAYTEIAFPYTTRQTDNWNSDGEGAMLGENVTYHGGAFGAESRDLFRFCGAAGEGFEIAMIFITNSSPKAQTKGIGTLKAQGLPLFAESSAFTPTGASVSTMNLYVASAGNIVVGKITGNNFDGGFMDQYQLRTWKINHQENKTGTTIDKTSSQAVFAISDGLFGIGESADGMVSVRAKIFGQSVVCSQKLPFRGTYVNTPTGDVTAPTLTNATKSYDEGTSTYSVTITGSDDSGEVFYFVENTTHPAKYISMTPAVVLNGASEGDHVQCYAVDFDGNMSAPVELILQVPACDNCFKITLP